MEDTLKRVKNLMPCPFCGSGDVFLHNAHGAFGAHVYCRECGLEAPTETGVTDQQAVGYWNTRRWSPSNCFNL
jgi:Lar family restriction alleviation protein